MKRLPEFRPTFLASLCLAALLAACGGGDDDDTVSPTLTVTTPALQDVASSSFTVTGTASDERSLSGVAIELNGTRVPATFTGVTFSATLTLQSGANSYKVIATDSAGHQTVREGQVYLDDVAPVLADITPAADLTLQRTRVTVAGTGTDARSLAGVEIQVNGGEATPLTLVDGAFSTQVDLVAGSNTIAVVATDAVGNVARKESKVYLGHRVAAGGSHSGAIAAGKLYTWGRNNLGQTGLGSTTTLAANAGTHPVTPQLRATTAEFVALSFNQNYSIALDTTGHLWSWGDDADGQLGRGADGRTKCTGTATAPPNCRLDIGRIDALENVLTVSAGYNHVLALKADGTVWGFGLNDLGQLGDGSVVARSTPVQVKWATTDVDAGAVGRILQVSASSKSSYAVDDKGQVWAWGRNQYANLGNGVASTATAVQSTPVKVPLPEGVKIVSVANGRDHVLALTADGRVYSWGLNATSQVGFNGYLHKGKTTAWPSPVLSPTLLPAFATDRAVEVYANGNTSYAMRAGGKVYPWGMWGTSTTTSTVYTDLDEAEDRLETLGGLADVAVGALHQVALRNDGKLFTWGWSFEGSLGADTTLNAWMYHVPLTPVLP